MNSPDIELVIPDSNEELKMLFKERKIPNKTWDEPLIEDLLLTLSLMDSNNFAQKASVGEREGRCFSSIVARRHYYFIHGIGRSGDLTEPQPKAAGSSILYKITNILLGDFMKLIGLPNVHSLLVPLSMDFSVRLGIILYSKKQTGNTQVWYDDEDIRNLILDVGMEACHISSPQYFFGTMVDEIVSDSLNCFVLNFKNIKEMYGVVKYCKDNYLQLILYNVQYNKELADLEIFSSNHDLIIIYEDNLSILPIGSTIIASSNTKIVEDFSKIYAGRASICSTIDVFVTLLSLGKEGILKLTEEKNKFNNLSVSFNKSSTNSTEVLLSNVELMQDLIPKTFLQKGLDALRARQKHVESLLVHGKIPDIGWNENMIEHFLGQLSTFEPKRTTNDRIRKRHYNFINGVDCFEPKINRSVSKTGASILRSVTHRLLQDLFTTMGIQSKIRCVLLPVATGMSLVLSMFAFRRLKPTAQYVIWSRIDQKSCIKSIITAGLVPIVVDTIRVGDEFSTDIDGIKAKIIEFGPENILCIMSTTSCFAPRACDNIESISAICKSHNLFHLVNNAYGVTSRYIMKRIHRAKLKGKLDIFVQSMDKNLNVPVGGAIVAVFADDEYKKIFKSLESVCSAKMSMTTILDAFITLVSMGKSVYIKMVDDRESMYSYLKMKLLEIAGKYKEEVIENPGNPISIALTLYHVAKENVTQLGSMLFLRNVFGSRIVTGTDTKRICDFLLFSGWGAHTQECNVPYIASAAAFGVCKEDIDLFIKKLDSQLLILNSMPS